MSLTRLADEQTRYGFDASGHVRLKYKHACETKTPRRSTWLFSFHEYLETLKDGDSFQIARGATSIV